MTRDYGLDALRQRMALVSQDTYLFNTTVRDNLRIADRSHGGRMIRPPARPTPMSSLRAYPTATTP
jgi:ABC-type transport system involved in cytochrome bd biosynthesis fused ATPase/permease subunit